MNKTLICISIFFLQFGHAKSCLENEERKDAKLKLKAELLCQQSVKHCLKVFKAPTQKKLKTVEVIPEGIQFCKYQDSFSQSLPYTRAVQTFFLANQKLKLKNDFEKRKYVNSISDFFRHTELHIKRVKVLGLALYDKYPQNFPGLSREQVSLLFDYHDIEKIDTSVLSKNGKPFIIELYDYFGKKAPLEVSSDLNNKGKIILNKVIDLGQEAKKSFQILESIPDFTDRAMNPVTPEEFGRATWLESQSDLSKKNPMYKQMAIYLEKNYKKIIPKNLNYSPATLNQQSKIIKKIYIDAQLSKLKNKANTKIVRSVGGVRALANTIKHAAKLSGSKALIRGGALAATVLTSSILDAALLLTYSTHTGCASDGGHPWVIQGFKCQPVPGLSELFVAKVLFSDSNTYNLNIFKGSTTCDVYKQNLAFNENKLFNKIKCEKNSVDMLLDKSHKLSVKYHDDRSIREVKVSENYLKLISNSSSRFKLKSINYNMNGDIESVCTRGINSAYPSVYTPSKCHDMSDEIFNKNKDLFNNLSTLNFKIYQSINCCNGEKDFLNDKIECS